MFDSLLTSVGMSIVRNAASAGAAALVANGLIQSSQTQDLIGSIIFLASMAFSIVEKIMAHKKINA